MNAAACKRTALSVSGPSAVSQGNIRPTWAYSEEYPERLGVLSATSPRINVKRQSELTAEARQRFQESPTRVTGRIENISSEIAIKVAALGSGIDNENRQTSLSIRMKLSGSDISKVSRSPPKL